MVAKPVEKLNRLIGYMIVGFVTAGILLFGISDQPVSQRAKT